MKSVGHETCAPLSPLLHTLSPPPQIRYTSTKLRSTASLLFAAAVITTTTRTCKAFVPALSVRPTPEASQPRVTSVSAAVSSAFIRCYRLFARVSLVLCALVESWPVTPCRGCSALKHGRKSHTPSMMQTNLTTRSCHVPQYKIAETGSMLIWLEHYRNTHFIPVLTVQRLPCCGGGMQQSLDL